MDRDAKERIRWVVNTMNLNRLSRLHAMRSATLVLLTLKQEEYACARETRILAGMLSTKQEQTKLNRFLQNTC
jgi:hypothetical protein